MKKYIVMYNPKGGCGKSSLALRIYQELTRTGVSCAMNNLDQQQHVPTIEDETASFHIYDTMGAFRGDTIELLKNAANREIEAVVIIPIGIGLNDWREFDFITEKVQETGVKEKVVFVFTRAAKNCPEVRQRKVQLSEMGFKSAKYVFPTLKDFALERDTPRTRNEISQLINEVIL